jgi:hypothetical protein
VADGDGGVLVQQQVGGGLADHGGPADHCDVPSGQLDLVVVQDRHHGLGGRRGERRESSGQAAQGQRVGAVDILLDHNGRGQVL